MTATEFLEKWIVGMPNALIIAEDFLKMIKNEQNIAINGYVNQVSRNYAAIKAEEPVVEKEVDYSIDLRMRCLELANTVTGVRGTTMDQLEKTADLFYEWVTKR